MILLLAALAVADIFSENARVPNSLVDVALLAIPLSFLFGLLGVKTPVQRGLRVLTPFRQEQPFSANRL